MDCIGVVRPAVPRPVTAPAIAAASYSRFDAGSKYLAEVIVDPQFRRTPSRHFELVVREPEPQHPMSAQAILAVRNVADLGQFATRTLASAFAAVFLTAATAASPSLCQTLTPPSRLGATDGRQPIAPPSAGPSLDAADDQHRLRSDIAASHLLETARQDHAQGHPEIAQRVLEVLIARYPDSPLTDTARRELFEIYAANENVAGASKNNRSARAPTQDPPFATAPIPAPVGNAPASGTWRTSVVNFRRLQDEFRNGVGDRVFFGDGSAELGSRARAVIAAQAAWLLARPEVEVVIEGHADDPATGTDPDALSRARAIAMRDRLIADGVEPERLNIVALGKRDPVAICPDSGCAGQNRRAVLQLGLRTQSEPSGKSGTPPRPDAASAGRRR